MSPETLDQIFDPLFTTKKSNKGTGLGLGVVHAIVKDAGGSIVVHSKPGKGSTFEMYFPKIAGNPDEQTGETLHVGSARKGRILLVDDNALELRSIHQMLIRFGYRVASTNDSLKALDLFRKTPEAFDLLITDQLMPVMNGDEMASHILEVRKDLPVILCSGSEEALQETKLRRDPFAVYLQKPFTSRILAEAIDQALGRNDLHFRKTVL
jgi:CheY-like chemotaxis protein